MLVSLLLVTATDFEMTCDSTCQLHLLQHSNRASALLEAQLPQTSIFTYRTSNSVTTLGKAFQAVGKPDAGTQTRLWSESKPDYKPEA